MNLEIRCSKLARPMTCAGSLFLTGTPDEENAAAKEGTAFGELLRLKLEEKPVPTHASNGIQFDSDMEFYSGPLAREIAERAAGNPISCETRIDWTTRSGIKICGSYDVSFASGPDDLYVDDAKYGWGIVEVKENWQLLGYAIGEVIRQQRAFKRIHLRIRQPRPHHEEGPDREWVLTYEELLHYKEVIETRMDQIALGYRDLTTSKHCKYCPSAGDSCPAINKAFYRGLEFTHEFVQDKMSEKELSFHLDLVNRADELIKIKKDSLNALAVHRIKNGAIIPGYITESSYGHRKWKKDVDPKAVETLTGRKLMTSALISPAQAEKLGINKEFLETLVEMPFLGQKVVKKDAGKSADKIFGAPK